MQVKMVNTRTSLHKQTGAEAASQIEDQETQPTPSATVTSLDDANKEVESLKQSLSPDSRTLVQIITIIITQQFSGQIDILKSELKKKETEISLLQNDVSNLNEKVEKLTQHLDNVEQYERRDTVLLSGPVLPNETLHENTTQVAIASIKTNLSININEKDISIAHRLGSSAHQKKRPIIVKFTNRSLKQELVRACVNLKPQLYINESLTPTRLSLFKQVLSVRKAHRVKFQQCYTNDGKIVIKLKNSTQKHIITDNTSLMSFLDKYPEMKDTYIATTTQQP